MRTLISLLAMSLLAVPVGAQEKEKGKEAAVDTAKATEQAEALKKAVLDGEYAKMADLTHPKVVEALGGKEKVVDFTKKVMEQMKAQGIELKTYTIDKPGTPVSDGKSAHYVVLPTKMEMTAPKTKIMSESYLLGMTTDGGKSWTFADGAGLAQGPAREAIVPTLPKELKLPEPKMPTVTTEKEKEPEKKAEKEKEKK